MKTLFLDSVFLLLGCGTEKGIEVHDAWIRPTVQGDNGAVYCVIHNHSSQPDELIGVRSLVAESAAPDGDHSSEDH